ncbi:MAG TPA: hypothetical protein PKE66_00685 [Pyrinomonadaceae bacterium]|nr:hypothetical protein [Pyrinomonadaceae bacterium]
MGDWIGLGIIVLVIAGAYFGLRTIARPATRTEEEFERRAAESTSGLGASVNALQEILDPGSAKAKQVAVEIKEGRYLRKKQDGEPGSN